MVIESACSRRRRSDDSARRVASLGWARRFKRTSRGDHSGGGRRVSRASSRGLRSFVGEACKANDERTRASVRLPFTSPRIDEEKRSATDPLSGSPADVLGLQHEEPSMGLRLVRHVHVPGVLGHSPWTWRAHQLCQVRTRLEPGLPSLPRPQGTWTTTRFYGFFFDGPISLTLTSSRPSPLPRQVRRHGFLVRYSAEEDAGWREQRS